MTEPQHRGAASSFATRASVSRPPLPSCCWSWSSPTTTKAAVRPAGPTTTASGGYLDHHRSVDHDDLGVDHDHRRL